MNTTTLASMNSKYAVDDNNTMMTDSTDMNLNIEATKTDLNRMTSNSSNTNTNSNIINPSPMPLGLTLLSRPSQDLDHYETAYSISTTTPMSPSSSPLATLPSLTTTRSSNLSYSQLQQQVGMKRPRPGPSPLSNISNDGNMGNGGGVGNEGNEVTLSHVHDVNGRGYEAYYGLDDMNTTAVSNHGDRQQTDMSSNSHISCPWRRELASLSSSSPLYLDLSPDNYTQTSLMYEFKRPSRFPLAAHYLYSPQLATALTSATLATYAPGVPPDLALPSTALAQFYFYVHRSGLVAAIQVRFTLFFSTLMFSISTFFFLSPHFLAQLKTNPQQCSHLTCFQYYPLFIYPVTSSCLEYLLISPSQNPLPVSGGGKDLERLAPQPRLRGLLISEATHFRYLRPYVTQVSTINLIYSFYLVDGYHYDMYQFIFNLMKPCLILFAQLI